MTTVSERLANGQTIFNAAKTFMQENHEVGGKKLSEWAAFFKVPHPNSDMSPQQCAQLSTTLLDLAHEATFRLTAAQSRFYLLKHQASTEMNLHVVDLVIEAPEGRRLPNKETVLAKAATLNTDVDTAFMFADLEIRFWKDILEYLSTTRKLIENISLNLSVELKATQMEGFIERAASKHSKEE